MDPKLKQATLIFASVVQLACVIIAGVSLVSGDCHLAVLLLILSVAVGIEYNTQRRDDI